MRKKQIQRKENKAKYKTQRKNTLTKKEKNEVTIKCRWKRRKNQKKYFDRKHKEFETNPKDSKDILKMGILINRKDLAG